MEDKKRSETPFLLLDGATGTQLLAAGMPLGMRPELMCFEAPEVVERVHRDYIRAGSGVIYANTFGANAHKLAGTGYQPAQVIRRAVEIARRAADGTDVKVALDIGPIGELLEPLGTLSFQEAYDLYREMVEAGAAAGADLVVFETMTDLGEVRAAVLAAKEHSRLPVYVTMTFEENRRTFTGCTVPAMALTLQGLGVDAVGVNCSLGPKEIYPLMEEMVQWTDLPLIVKPNAGLPDPVTNAYDLTPEEFARQMTAFADLGITILGGLLRHHPGVYLHPVRRPGGLRPRKTAPQEPPRGLLRLEGGGAERRPGHRGAHQPHREKAVPAGPPGA